MEHPKIKIGDYVDSKYGRQQVKAIELMPIKGMVEGGIEIPEIWESLKDYCVFDLSNSHYIRGDYIKSIEKP